MVPLRRWPIVAEVVRYPAVQYVAHVSGAELFDHMVFAIARTEGEMTETRTHTRPQPRKPDVRSAWLGVLFGA